MVTYDKDGSPASGETVQLRSRIRFATGMAPLVKDSRWFRDTERRDIQAELPGWPEGPTFTLNSTGQRAANAAVSGFIAAIPLVANILTNLSGTGGSPYDSDKGISDATSKDTENEVEDFPVMWAAEGAIARTVPWQLDPGRRVDGYKTEAVVTDRRLVILGTPPSGEPSTLWEVPRELISSAEAMEFSRGNDIRIVFSDLSWVRLATGFKKNRRMANILNGRSRVLQESELTPGQRNCVAEYIAGMRSSDAKIADPPVFTFLPSGVVLAEIHIRNKKETTYQFHMGPDGKHLSSQPGDL